MESAKGFTLIELLIAMVVLAIGLSIAVPGFTSFIEKGRAESQRESLVTALSLARSEAVKRGATVTIAPLSGSNWSSGWAVKVGTTTLREFPALQRATLNRSASGYTGTLQFNSRGQLEGATLAQSTVFEFRVSGDYCAYERDITINSMGRVAVTARSCS